MSIAQGWRYSSLPSFLLCNVCSLDLWIRILPTGCCLFSMRRPLCCSNVSDSPCVLLLIIILICGCCVSALYVCSWLWSLCWSWGAFLLYTFFHNGPSFSRFCIFHSLLGSCWDGLGWICIRISSNLVFGLILVSVIWPLFVVCLSLLCVIASDVLDFWLPLWVCVSWRPVWVGHFLLVFLASFSGEGIL